MLPYIASPRLRITILLWLTATIVGCNSPMKLLQPTLTAPTNSKPISASAKDTSSDDTPPLPPAKSGHGGYYQDDGPGEHPPAGLQATPDAVPTLEPYSRSANRPYVVFGKTYVPITDSRPLSQHGVGSWYGKKFHGQRTSSGELYDMYKMTAAHPILPIPSYARVTNLNNGKQVIVRINDRGPFHSNRIIDLSYTAALKLGYLGSGSSELLVERLLSEDIEKIAQAKKDASAAIAAIALPLPTIPTTPPPVDAVSTEITRMLQTDSAAGQPISLVEQPDVTSKNTLSAGISTNHIYLQLGAFSQAENAQSTRSRLTQLNVTILPPIDMVRSGDFFKLYSGPFTSRWEAEKTALKLQEFGIRKVLIVER